MLDTQEYNLHNKPWRLYDQCLKYAISNLGEAVEGINKIMGEGYAQKHPELLGQVLTSASIDFVGAFFTPNFIDILKETNKAIDNATSTLWDIKTEIEKLDK